MITIGARTACAAVLLVTMGRALAQDAQIADRPYQSLPYAPSLDVASMDRSIDACEDLYAYSCGDWQKRNPVPADQSSWSVYGKLHADNQRYLWGILEDSAKPSAGRTPTQQKIGDYFVACMNVDAVEKAGSSPLAADLVRIEAMQDKGALGAFVGELHARTASTGVLFATSGEQDARDVTRVVVAIHAGGLGLPDRDYYLKDDPRSRQTRTRYFAHVTKMFELLGEDPAATQAAARVVMRIETALAKATLSLAEQRDPYRAYHRQTLAGLQKLAPALDWQAYFQSVGFSAQPWLNLSQPAFVKELNARIAGENLADLKTYLRWALVDATAPLSFEELC